MSPYKSWLCCNGLSSAVFQHPGQRRRDTTHTANPKTSTRTIVSYNN